MAATEGLFASINPTIMQEKGLGDALVRAVYLIASMQSRSNSTTRAVYTSITKTFDRIGHAGKGALLGFDVTNLTSLMLNQPETEALRQARADAMLAIRRAAPTVASEMVKNISS